VKKLIFRYLNENYGWKYDALILLQPKELVNFRNLIKDLTTVFGLTKKQTKWYIKSWVKKTNSRVDFNTLWRNTTFILGATWTPELAQDVSAFEAELTTMLSEQIAAEIDREILNRMLNLA
jgi:hypothetical protein